MLKGGHQPRPENIITDQRFEFEHVTTIQASLPRESVTSVDSATSNGSETSSESDTPNGTGKRRVSFSESTQFVEKELDFNVMGEEERREVQRRMRAKHCRKFNNRTCLAANRRFALFYASACGSTSYMSYDM
eukprot:comp10560_c0_seq1/m.5267 comp10560_c0_seq1/g.5267  ORF comp10560_c0_seq1/g.5267 comp10560_c0_seq1/m.5267 type:complete len:133 (-) comp10560_c0_seq1:837-1235(-)